MNATWRQLIPRTLFMLLALASNSLSSERFYEHGWTPVHFAVISGKGLEELLLTGADVNTRDKEAGDTPLHLASRVGLVAAVEVLLKHGGLITATNKFGSTPLHSAAHSDSSETIELLLANKAELEAKNHDGMTPLAYAARWGRADAVKTLLRHGASAASHSASGDTAVELASTGLRQVETDLARAKQDLARKDEPFFIQEVTRTYGSEAKWREGAERYAKEKEDLRRKYAAISKLLRSALATREQPELPNQSMDSDKK